jgi:tRNA pseudouridine38-40 synthase
VTLRGTETHRIRLTLHYDGAGFNGWQVQPGARTVQGEIEAALTRLLTKSVRIAAAGRTDAGVHATGQVVSLDVPVRWTPHELRRALNAVLPDDVWVSASAAAAPDFHARFSAIARGYVYRIGTADIAASPFLRHRCWPMRQALPLDALNDAASRLVGEHSFLAFAKAGQPERGDRCTVHRSDWRPWRTYGLEYHVVANRFLHHMVRYLVGTMVDAARGRRPIDEIDALLRGTTDLETSPPAPGEGLYLSRVYYSPEEIQEESLDETVPG